MQNVESCSTNLKYGAFHTVLRDYKHLQQETKGPTLMELFIATRKLTKFLLTTRDVQCVQHGWQNWPEPVQRHLQRLWATTWLLLAQTPSFSKLFIPRTNGLVCRWVLCVICMKCTLHSNHRFTRVIFQHTKRILSRSGHFLTTYTRIS